MAFRKTIKVDELANDDFEIFVNSIEVIPKLRQLKAAEKVKKQSKLTSIKVYEIRKLPKFCKSMKSYKKEVEIPVDYTDSEEDVEKDMVASCLARSSSIRQALRRRRDEALNLGKVKSVKLKRGRRLRFSKDGYAYRMWKNILNMGSKDE